MDDMSATQEPVNTLHLMDSDELVSVMTLADRQNDYEQFSIFRNELMYRLRCAEPLINWHRPVRIERKYETKAN